jgi:hypothetical protein
MLPGWTTRPASATLEPVTAPTSARAAHLSPQTPARDHPQPSRNPQFRGNPRRQGPSTALDDAGLTGTGQSSADVLGVPGTVLAERLTGHLVREIMLRGSGGGPLTPLADQLNHDRTYLQGQRVEGIVARLVDEVWDAQVRSDNGAVVVGPPLGEVTDPIALGQ